MSRRSCKPKPLIERQPIPLGNLDPDAVKVIRRLVYYHHEAYLVGGCVRDLLLGCRPKDFDVATSARPQDLRRIFRNCRIIGRRFRLAHMHFRDGKIIEVATFRRKPPTIASDACLLVKRDNAFGEPHEDAMRRDFTINGLFYDVGPKRIIDYVHGLEDIDRRLMRTIGDPVVRIEEDPLRILRAIRFTASRGLGMDPALYEASIRQRGSIVRAAPPRVFEEILKFLRGGAAQRSIYLAWEMGQLAEILPALDRWLSSQRSRAHHTFRYLYGADVLVKDGRLPSDSVLLAVLLYDRLSAAIEGISNQAPVLQETLRPIAEQFVIPRRLRDEVSQIVTAQRRLADSSKIKKSGLPRRDFYADALDLKEIIMWARGTDWDEVVGWRRGLPAPLPSRFKPPRRKTRRPRRGKGRRR